MLTIKVTWQGLAGQWQVQPLDAEGGVLPAAVSLAQWASDQPDLLPVRMLLSATNYSCQWLDLPGVSSRHLVRALPFALEENLVADPTDYVIVPAGKQGSRVRAYLVDQALVSQLLEVCALHHVQVRELIPETSVLLDSAIALWQDDGWLLRLPGVFEGWVSSMAVNAILESVLEGWNASELVIAAEKMDQTLMLKSIIETGFAGVFDSIELQSGTRLASYVREPLVRPVSLLAGQFQVRDSGNNRPAAWWRPLLPLSAACLLLWAVATGISNHQLRQQVAEINGRSLALYKQLFPGERIRDLNRDFRSKLDGGNKAPGGGFVSLVNRTSQAYAATGIKTLQISSIRFSDRQQELIVEVQAANLNDLQTLRQALEKQGLVAEVSSASNDKNVVKGRLKVGEPA
jgi:general secretion pathway protein L